MRCLIFIITTKRTLCKLLGKFIRRLGLKAKEPSHTSNPMREAVLFFSPCAIIGKAITTGGFFLHFQRVFSLCILAFLLLSAKAGAAENIQITAASAILIEASTGRVLYEKAADVPRFPASTTKMMTCVLAIEEGDLSSILTVSRTAAETEDTEVGAGDRFVLAELVAEMMLRSDNGAAVAIAEDLAGSVGSFAAHMNEKAKAIGAKDTHFVNPNGLPNPAHVSTAHDIARIAAYGMKNPKFRSFVGAKEREITWVTPEKKRALMANTNRLLSTYEGATGIKTGYTNAAGGCLAASARRGGVELIAVVLGAADEEARFTDAAKLLDMGFRRVKAAPAYTKTDLARRVWVKGGKEGRLTVYPTEDLRLPLVDGEAEENYRLTYDLPRVIAAGVKEGDRVGDLVVSHGGKELTRIPLRAEKSVGRGLSIEGLWAYVLGLFA